MLEIEFKRSYFTDYKYFPGFSKKKYRSFRFEIRNLLFMLHLCAQFHTIAQLYQNFRFFGFLPVFQKITGQSCKRFETYPSRCTCVWNFSTIAQLYQNYRFSVFYRFLRKIPEILRIRNLWQNYVFPLIFIKIGPFFDFRPKLGRVLIITQIPFTTWMRILRFWVLQRPPAVDSMSSSEWPRFGTMK